jgi:hypothetical protein
VGGLHRGSLVAYAYDNAEAVMFPPYRRHPQCDSDA